ncbi:hypothetical protein STEG23_033233, partial [Scotinomys teguina]
SHGSSYQIFLSMVRTWTSDLPSDWKSQSCSRGYFWAGNWHHGTTGPGDINQIKPGTGS